MNSTQRAALEKLRNKFGEEPFFLHMPKRDMGGEFMRPGRGPRYAIATKDPERPREFRRNTWRDDFQVQMRKGTVRSLIRRGHIRQQKGNIYYLGEEQRDPRIRLLWED